jgi:acyl-CoA dehydrogenase
VANPDNGLPVSHDVGVPRSESGDTHDEFKAAVRYAADVAASAAEDVDLRSRFPNEALEAFKESRLLSALAPRELGGMGATVADVSDAVRAIALNCSASALLLAMHSIDVANLVRLASTDALRDLVREIAAVQLLCANANSEVGLGGDVGRSNCAIERTDGRLTLTKDALAISFGEYADLIFSCARRSPDSEATDQVQVICRRPRLEPLSEWDAIGLRGTCSRSFRLVAEIDPSLIYPVPFPAIVNTGGMQNTLLLFSSVWVGVAEAAATKAHAYVRASARRAVGTTPKSALRLAELSVRLDQLRALLSAACMRVETARSSGTMEDQDLIAMLRNLKVATSEGAVSIAKAALEICGIAGYRRDTPFSLDRQLRDACGSLVMISNDRLLHAGAEMLVIRKHL